VISTAYTLDVVYADHTVNVLTYVACNCPGKPGHTITLTGVPVGAWLACVACDTTWAVERNGTLRQLHPR